VTVGGYKPKLEEIKNGILKSIQDKLLFAGKDEGPKTFQELYSILVYPEIKLYSWDYNNLNVVKDKLKKINQDQIKKRQQFLIDIKKDLSIPLPLEYIKTGNKEILNKASEEAIKKHSGGFSIAGFGKGGGSVSLAEDLDEIIKKLGKRKYRLYSKKKNPKTGKRKDLGTFNSRKAAKKREGQIQYFKHLKEENEEIIYFPAKHLKSTKGEYNKEQEWKDFAKLSDRDKVEWAKGVVIVTGKQIISSFSSFKCLKY